MTVKESIRAELEKRRGEYVSGEELARLSGCTRGAVWKAVRSLEADGYEITAVTNRGYRLGDGGDVISAEGILSLLPSGSIILPEVHRELDSTNIRAKALAAEGAPEGTLVVAGTQTAGRGRLGRSFFSPSDTGVYMSMVLRPKMPAGEAVLITAAAAAAVALAVEELSGRRTEIKWVNDVYIDGLKICGILTEASMSLENGGVEYAVLGIGINAYEPREGFPPELRGKIGAVYDEKRGGRRCALIARVASLFTEYYDKLGEKQYMDCYRERLMWKGGRISVISQNGSRAATLIDADENASLIVRYDDGEQGLISSGEISIRSDD